MNPVETVLVETIQNGARKAFEADGDLMPVLIRMQAKKDLLSENPLDYEMSVFGFTEFGEDDTKDQVADLIEAFIKDSLVAFVCEAWVSNNAEYEDKGASKDPNKKEAIFVHAFLPEGRRMLFRAIITRNPTELGPWTNEIDNADGGWKITGRFGSI